MMDGVGVMDTGSNRPLLQMNVESIAEVKVLTSVYQAEYGRSSGLQITAVTKSGTNRFRGSAYDVIRDSKFNANSKVNILNGNAKAHPEGKGPGLLDRRPHRQAGRRPTRCSSSTARSSRRAPAATTSSDSASRPRRSGPATSRQSTDQNGALYNLIKDPSSPIACTAADTRGCFQDGGVIGKIPASAALSDRAQHPEAVSAAERQRAGRVVQLRDHPADADDSEHAAGVQVRLSADVQAPRDRQVLGLVSSAGT